MKRRDPSKSLGAWQANEHPRDEQGNFVGQPYGKAGWNAVLVNAALRKRRIASFRRKYGEVTFAMKTNNPYKRGITEVWISIDPTSRRWRVTAVDAKGPFGHSEYASWKEAVYHALLDWKHARLSQVKDMVSSRDPAGFKVGERYNDFGHVWIVNRVSRNGREISVHRESKDAFGKSGTIDHKTFHPRDFEHMKKVAAERDPARALPGAWTEQSLAHAFSGVPYLTFNPYKNSGAFRSWLVSYQGEHFGKVTLLKKSGIATADFYYAHHHGQLAGLLGMAPPSSRDPAATKRFKAVITFKDDRGYRSTVSSVREGKSANAVREEVRTQYGDSLIGVRIESISSRDPAKALNKKHLWKDINREHKKEDRAKILKLEHEVKSLRPKKACHICKFVCSEHAAKRLEKQDVRRKEVAKVHHLHAKTTLASERAHRRELRIIERGQRKARTERPKTSAREHAGESDDEVRGNIGPELIPLFNKMRRHIKASPRKSRTEAFFQWVNEHPSEMHGAAEDETDRMIREHEMAMRDPRRMPKRPWHLTAGGPGAGFHSFESHKKSEINREIKSLPAKYEWVRIWPPLGVLAGKASEGRPGEEITLYRSHHDASKFVSRADFHSGGDPSRYKRTRR